MVFALAAPSAGDAFLALAVYDSTDPHIAAFAKAYSDRRRIDDDRPAGL
jgi:hypothetical protein